MNLSYNGVKPTTICRLTTKLTTFIWQGICIIYQVVCCSVLQRVAACCSVLHLSNHTTGNLSYDGVKQYFRVMSHNPPWQFPMNVNFIGNYFTTMREICCFQWSVKQSLMSHNPPWQFPMNVNFIGNCFTTMREICCFQWSVKQSLMSHNPPGQFPMNVNFIGNCFTTMREICCFHWKLFYYHEGKFYVCVTNSFYICVTNSFYICVTNSFSICVTNSFSICVTNSFYVCSFESHKVEKLRFLSCSRYKFKLRFRFALNLYQSRTIFQKKFWWQIVISLVRKKIILL